MDLQWIDNTILQHLYSYSFTHSCVGNTMDFVFVGNWFITINSCIRVWKKKKNSCILYELYIIGTVSYRRVRKPLVCVKKN